MADRSGLRGGNAAWVTGGVTRAPGEAGRRPGSRHLHVTGSHPGAGLPRLPEFTSIPEIGRKTVAALKVPLKAMFMPVAPVNFS